MSPIGVLYLSAFVVPPILLAITWWGWFRSPRIDEAPKWPRLLFLFGLSAATAEVAMKSSRIWLLLAFACALLFCSWGCGSGGTSPPVTLVSIQLTPSVPPLLTVSGGLQFKAIGTYSDGHIQDLTTTASWTSSNTSVATVSAGQVSAKSAGQTTIAATMNSVPASTQLTVLPPLTALNVAPSIASVVRGNYLPFTATATFNDGSQRDLTTQATWNSSNPCAASVSSSGVALGNAVGSGSTAVSASFNGVNGSATLSVTAPPGNQRFLYVSNGLGGDGDLLTIDALSAAPCVGSTFSIPFMGPLGLALKADNQTLYVSEVSPGFSFPQVYLLDATTFPPTDISSASDVPPSPVYQELGANFLKLAPDGKELYVSSFTGGVFVDDLTTSPPNVLAAFGGSDVVVSPDSQTAYLYDQSGTVTEINVSTTPPVAVGTVSTGLLLQNCIVTADYCMQLHGVAMSPDGKRLYVIGVDTSNRGTLDVLDASVTPPSILSTSVVGHAPFAVAASPDGMFVYIASASDQTLLVLNTSNLSTPAFVIKLDGPPRAVAFSSDSAVAYVGVDAAVEFFSVGTSPPAVIKRAVFSPCCYPLQMEIAVSH